MKRATGVAAILVATALLALALLAVLPAPTYNLWKLKILVTECGHFVAPLALLTLAVWRSSKLTRIAATLAGLAACLFLIPMLQGIAVLRTLPEPRPSVARYLWRLYTWHEQPVTPQRYELRARNGAMLSLLFYPSALKGVSRPPLVVGIHGGSWQGGDPGQLPALNYRLAHRGYAVAAITYRFAPRDTFPAQLEDVHDAVAFLVARASSLGFDPARVVLLGRSAGGQLALLEAYTAPRSQYAGVVALYAPTDLAWGYAHPSRARVHPSRRYLSEYIGGAPDTHADAYRRASPITFADSTTPRALLIHGASDELVFHAHAERLASVLLARHRPPTFITLPWATHGCDYIVRGPCYQISALVIDRFLEQVTAR